MGGQACVFYGAAELSRVLDLLVLVDAENLDRIRRALADLEAEPIAVPDLDAKHLTRGHAVHFRCRREDVSGLRIDRMSSLRGVGAFDDLWKRRTSIEVGGEALDMLGLQDLVQAKKTQRDKDWPMIRRLIERSFYENRGTAGVEQVEFWLRELRTPELLLRVVDAHPEKASRAAESRLAVRVAMGGDAAEVARALLAEEAEERRKDRAYWEPLRQELPEFRRQRSLRH